MMGYNIYFTLKENNMKLRCRKSWLIKVLAVFALVFMSCSAEYYLKAGNKSFDKADYSKAIINYSNAIEKSSSNADALYQRGRSYLKLDDKANYENAVKDFDALMSSFTLKPDNKQDGGILTLMITMFSKYCTRAESDALPEDIKNKLFAKLDTDIETLYEIDREKYDYLMNAVNQSQ
jgi:tetratricopeptide (TPR) repeat protein